MNKSCDTKEKLMEAAIRLIWKSAYHNVGVAGICAEAGVTKGGFYHHFETKADLFYEASLYHWESMKPHVEEVFSPRHTPLEQLELLVEFIINKQKENVVDETIPVSGCPFFTSGAQCGAGEEKVNQASREMSERVVQYNTALVRQLKGDGALNGDPDPEQLGRIMHQYIMGLLLYARVVRSLDVVIEDLGETIYRLLDLKAEFRKKK